MKAVQHTTMIAALVLCTAVAMAQEPKPVTLEIASGTAKAIKVSKAVTREVIPSRFAGGDGWKAIDGITLFQGKAKITVPWSRINTVTISEPSKEDGNSAVVVELMSGEKETLLLDAMQDTREYIVGETTLGTFKIMVTDIRSIKKVVEPSAPEVRPPAAGGRP